MPSLRLSRDTAVQPPCQLGSEFAPTAIRQRQPGPTPENRLRARAALLPGIIARCLAATALAACAPAAAAPIAPAAAQPAGPRADLTAPTADDAMLAYRTMRLWLDGWAVPPAPGPAELPSAEGASVTLRFDGQVIGRASELAIGPADDRGRIIYRALVAAYGEADRRAPIEHDALREQKLRTLGSRVMLAVELAGPLTPVEPVRAQDLDALLAPGLDGLAVRLGNRTEAMFPGTMLATNTAPSEAVRALVARLTEQPSAALSEPKDLIRQGMKFFKFRSTLLAQAEPGASPVFLQRGQRAVPLADVSARAGLVHYADALARHLESRRYAGAEPLGMHGTYLPWRNQYQPLIAEPHEQALAALALTRYGAYAAADPDLANRARVAAAGLLRDLHAVDPSESSPYDDAPASALILATLGWHRGDAAVPAADMARAARARLRAAFDPGNGFDASVPPAAWGVIALGEVYGASFDVAPGPNARTDLNRALDERARPAIRRAFRDTQPTNLFSLMPFLAWAEIEASATADADVPAAGALRQMRSTLWRAQLSAADAGPDRQDAVGGVLFTTAPGTLPTWNTARPLAAAATMLGDGRLTEPGERAGEVVRILGALRFLNQQTADDSIGWMAPSPALSVGGVRAAPWDARMPVSATAMTLLSVVETIRALDALAPAPPRAASPEEPAVRP